MVHSGEVITPPVEVGLLAGITRRRVIALCEQEGIVLHERRITPDVLRASSEVFLTSSIRGIMPVTKLDGDTVGGGGPGPKTRQLMTAYEAWLSAIACGDGAQV